MTSATKFWLAAGFITTAFAWPCVSKQNPAYVLVGHSESLGDVTTHHSLLPESTNIGVAFARPVVSLVYVGLKNVGRFFFADQEWVDDMQNLFAFRHVPNSPYPNVAIINSVFVSTAALTPNFTNTNTRPNHVDHAPISVANRYCNGFGPSAPLLRRDPDRPLSINNARKPTSPLAVGHFRELMFYGRRLLRSFHDFYYTAKRRESQPQFCICPACGWHGRCWSLAPLALATEAP